MGHQDQTKSGVIFAISAYTIWGVAPIYFKQLLVVPAAEILMHRVFWSVILLAILILLLRGTEKVKVALASPKLLLTLFVAGILLAGNWLLYIWSVNNNHLIEASLGYFINPMVNVALGRIFLGEKLRKIQLFAVLLACVGIGLLLYNFGRLPWIALALAFSFGIYGLLRKKAAVDSMPGLFLETSMMLPAALIYWIFFAGATANMLTNTSSLNLLLMAAGIITVAPLLCFTAAARRIQYSTLGFFQYICPSLLFGLAVFIYGEHMSSERLLTFLFVWTALLIFTLDSLHNYRAQKKLLMRPS
ncbi:EamA family transporter RarD [Glaciecola sp. 1036]|uniref:EamA family transporter RarD n=1 Tax=Alteromonadaceae TaxID=72275 RepID=UPI003D015CEE